MMFCVLSLKDYLPPILILIISTLKKYFENAFEKCINNLIILILLYILFFFFATRKRKIGKKSEALCSNEVNIKIR